MRDCRVMLLGLLLSACSSDKVAKLTAPLEVSTVRPTDHGPGRFFACLKGTMLPSSSPKAAADDSAREPSIFSQPPPSSSEPRVVYYSVFFDNDVYKGTRQSAIIETCETQQFIPVNLSPPPAPPKSPQSANNNWVSRVVCVSPRFVQARCLREAGFQLE